MSHFCPSNPLRISLLALVAGLSLAVTGCAVNSYIPANGTDAIAAPVTGIIHGGPNPVVGAEVILYSTTSSGYGVGSLLQEATQVGASAHQDTSSTGSFSFAGGFTCPAGQFAYVAAYGGNSGSGNNPNSVLMAALGPCSNISSSTYVWIDELTTVAAGYALSNFINISGNALAATGYTVGVGASATNNASSGCVSNAFYGRTSCPTTSAAGLAHAFAMAGNLVNTTTGQVNQTTSNSAVIPAQLINTLGNVLQTCVNSTGGGTSTTTGLPTTTTTSSGASHDGTACGRLSAYTSYTSNGTSSGTLTAAGNTLGYIQNLAKRPGGTVATFDSACDSNSGSGTTTAATCIFNLVTTQTFYTTAMTAAPPDWMLAIFYPKASLSNTANTTTGCSGSPAGLGLLYPYFVATDINDNIAILNGDGNVNVCYNLITIGFDGTPLAADQFDNTSQQLTMAANDSFGHTIIPVHPTSGTTGGSVRVYSTGTDSTINLVNSVSSSISATAADPYFLAVDQADNIYINSEGALTAGGDFGYLFPSGTESHSTPTYTGGILTSTSTSKGLQISMDINGNVFQETSASTGSTRPYFTPQGGTSFTEAGTGDEGTGSSSNGLVQFPDTNGKDWIAYTPGSSAPTQGSPVSDIVFSSAYTVSSGTVTFGSTATVYSPTTATPASDYKLEGGTIDGNNVIWWADLQGQTTCNGASCTQTTPYTPPATPVVINTSYLHGFDTVNGDYLPTYYGCEFSYATSTLCGSQPSDTVSPSPYPGSYPYALYGVRGLAVDSAGNIWTANGTQGHITEIIGMAAPTWPMFIHNGSSNKP
jgi:hypothetical protein